MPYSEKIESTGNIDFSNLTLLMLFYSPHRNKSKPCGKIVWLAVQI